MISRCRQTCHLLIQPVVLACLLAACAVDPLLESPPPVPVAVSPEVDADILINARTRFVWSPVAGAENYEFHVFDRETSDIARYYRRDLRSNEVCNESECSITLGLALPYLDGHAWRVRAGNRSGWSGWTRRTFTMVQGGYAPGNVRGVPVR